MTRTPRIWGVLLSYYRLFLSAIYVHHPSANVIHSLPYHLALLPLSLEHPLLYVQVEAIKVIF